MQWKLTHKNQKDRIENEGGKTLSYDPNLGIQIIDQDGFAFKDINQNGKLDPFEDWRLPLEERVRDFSVRFHLWQEGDNLFYNRGKITMPKDFCLEMKTQNLNTIWKQIDKETENSNYLQDNYIIAILLLMFDNDCDTGKEDYLIQLIIQSMELGLLENVVYSIVEALKKFSQKNKELLLQQGL